MLSNDVLDLIGRAGSAGGSDSGGESGSGAFELGGGGGGGMYCKYSELSFFVFVCFSLNTLGILRLIIFTT